MHQEFIKRTDIQVTKNYQNIEKIRKVLFGNGEKGMDEELREVKTTVQIAIDKFDVYISEQLEEKKREQKKKDAIQLLFIGAMITNGFIVLGGIFTWFIKIYPILDSLNSGKSVVGG